jgi:AraC family transcriptional regulator, transcriptional activator of pobA
MAAIKRFNSSSLSEILGLAPSSGSFIFKPADHVRVSYPEPHRKEMFSLGLITGGTAKLKIDLDSYVVQAPGLVAIGPDDVRQWILNESDIKITGLFFTEDFAISGLSDALFLKRLTFYQKSGPHFIPLNPDELSALKFLFHQIGKKYRSIAPNKMESIQAMLRVLLLEVVNIQRMQVQHSGAKHLQAHYLTAKFEELLALHYERQRTVSYYAGQLFISPKHLSQTVKEQTGKTARELIDERVCLEAKILLQIEELNISQISQQLNFANPSFFGKFFKGGTGMGPQQYRSKLVQP